MNIDQDNQNEEKAAAVLKEVYQKAANTPVDETFADNNQSSPEDAAEQLKGSDADSDKSVGQDEQPTAAESAEEIKGSDADSDKGN